MLAIAPERSGAVQTLCERERCPFAVLGDGDGRRASPGHRREAQARAGRHRPLGRARQAAEDAARRAARARRARAVRARAHRAARRGATACCAIRRSRDKTFLIAIGDRTVGGLCSRDPFVGPWQVPVADCAVTLLDFDGYAGEAFAIGERTPLALIDAPASGRMAVGEALTNLAAARGRLARPRQALGQLDGGRGPSGRGRGALRHGARGGARALPGARRRRSRWARIRCRCAPPGSGQGGGRAAVADRLRVRAGRRRARARSRRSCAPMRARPSWC